MKRAFIIPLMFLLTLCACGTASNAADSDRPPVVINIPSTEESTYESATSEQVAASSDITSVTSSDTKSQTDGTTDMPSRITESDLTATVSSSATSSDKTAVPETEVGYCGNKNSKVFHKSTCGSVSRMKEENKEFLSDRAAYISNGYSPCKKCKP